jgi:hypothetical protein
MLVDIVLPGWVPFYGINLSEDVPGYMGAPRPRPYFQKYGANLWAAVKGYLDAPSRS